MKLWLIGMMGSGKTSAGRLAASHLGVAFADTDELVERLVGTSIAAFWADFGEDAFREKEREVVASLETADGVVATGGGVVLDGGNRSIMASSGTVVWLDARPPALAARVDQPGARPILVSSGLDARTTLAATLAERSNLYRELAHHRVATDELTAVEVAREIELLWKS